MPGSGWLTPGGSERASSSQVRGSAWFAAGLVLAAVISPAVTLAAVSLIKVEGNSGTVADVTGDRQLLVAESDPKAFVISGYPETDSTGGCVVLNHRPAGKGMIVRQVRIFVKSSGAFDANHGLLLYSNATCAGAIAWVYVPTGAGSYTETFDPGLPVKAGGGVSVLAFGSGVVAETEITGFSVPAAVIP